MSGVTTTPAGHQVLVLLLLIGRETLANAIHIAGAAVNCLGMRMQGTTLPSGVPLNAGAQQTAVLLWLLSASGLQQ